MSSQSKIVAWLDNFWYHHKWQTVFVAFVIMVVVICAMQMGAETDFDARVLYAGPHLFTAEEKAEVESAFTQLLSKDYNEDGKKNTQLADLTIFTNDQLSVLLNQTDDVSLMMQYSTYSEDKRKQSFTQEITAGENVICLLDPHWYALIREQSGLVSLEEVLGYRPEHAIDENGIYLKDTPFGQYFECFDGLPEDTILCMRVLSASMIFSGNKGAQERYGHHQKILGDVFGFKLPVGFVPRPSETTGAEGDKEETGGESTEPPQTGT